MSNKKKVVVGMSGGVDSSVAALLLKEQGYDVVGLFMRNWHEEDESGVCTAEQDYSDVRRVAGLIDVPYYTIDLSKEYADRVFKYFLEEYSHGRTPNPDVLCNREIKFGPFKEFASSIGADYIATGHYAGIETKNGKNYLIRAKDENKDQTYFLNQLSQKQIENVLFPLTEIDKPEVREIAKKYNLATAEKKDSTGICFIGERNFRKFLAEYLPMKPGKIKTLDGKTIGEHDGVFFYTIGQRKGFGVGGVKGANNDAPYYVVKKDVEHNILYVNQGECDELFSTEIFTEKFNYITDHIEPGTRVLLRTRHREKLIPATAYPEGDTMKIVADTPVRAVTPGQYAVIYGGRTCIGGGKINKSR